MNRATARCALCRTWPGFQDFRDGDFASLCLSTHVERVHARPDPDLLDAQFAAVLGGAA